MLDLALGRALDEGGKGAVFPKVEQDRIFLIFASRRRRKPPEGLNIFSLIAHAQTSWE